MTPFAPAYVHTYQQSLLKDKIRAATAILQDCTLCPRQCRVNRLEGQSGICNTGRHAWVSSYNPHFGEEAPLVGQGGSGTIFLTHCNLLCSFCQNYDISHQGVGEEVSDEQLARMMLLLQSRGCHNINFVTPSHVVPQILSALEIAVEGGLNVPLVYNSGGYDAVETLQLLEGVFDIYMPDFKFWDADVAKRTCKAPDYPEVVRRAVLEMHRQVGDLVLDESGIAQRGLLVRHLVMPKNQAGTQDVMRFIARKVSANTYTNVMAQYRPCGRAHDDPELAERLSPEEFEAALQAAKEQGIKRLDHPANRIFRVLWNW